MNPFLFFALLLISFPAFAAKPAKQCATWSHNGRDVKHCAPFESWVLEYHCDASENDGCIAAFDARKVFDSKSEAIAWAEMNYTYIPDILQHRGEFLSCSFEYLY